VETVDDVYPHGLVLFNDGKPMVQAIGPTPEAVLKIIDGWQRQVSMVAAMDEHLKVFSADKEGAGE